MSFRFFEVFASALSAFYALVPSYGLAIILLTLAVRVILLPLSIKQTRSMRETQKIQPEVKRLQQKYKGDRQKLNTEMMALYKEHGVNPFGGCAPLLLQFPVLIALYYVIKSPLEYLGRSVLASDLTHHTLEVHRFIGLRLDCHPSQVLAGKSSATLETVACGSGLLSFLPYLVMILLMGFTTYYQQHQMQASRGPADPQAQQMQMFMKIMPVLLMVFAFNFPTGVVLYWLTTNAWTIVQQRIILRAAPPADSKGASQERAGKSSKKEVSQGSDGAAPAGKGAKKPQLKSGPGKPPQKNTGRKSPSGSAASGRGKANNKKRK